MINHLYLFGNVHYKFLCRELEIFTGVDKNKAYDLYIMHALRIIFGLAILYKIVEGGCQCSKSNRINPPRKAMSFDIDILISILLKVMSLKNVLYRTYIHSDRMWSKKQIQFHTKMPGP